MSGKNGVIIRPIPPAVKDQFKAACARRGEFMRDVLIAFMREYAARDKEVIPPQTKRGKKAPRTGKTRGIVE